MVLKSRNFFRVLPMNPKNRFTDNLIAASQNLEKRENYHFA